MTALVGRRPRDGLIHQITSRRNFQVQLSKAGPAAVPGPQLSGRGRVHLLPVVWASYEIRTIGTINFAPAFIMV